MSTSRQNAGRSGRSSLPPAMRETRLPPISRPARIDAHAASSTPPAQAVSPRRSYGSGSLFSKAGSWYGQWWVGERRVKRKLGAVREPGTRDGLTKAQAERELRRRMDTQGATPLGERLTVSEGAERLIDHLEAYGLKATTIATYRSLSRTHFERHFPDRALARITTRDVERMVAAMRRGGAGAKLINNAITLLGQVFDYGLDRGWCNANPARKVRRPRVEQSDAIRFLDQAEVEAMLRAAASDTDRAVPHRRDDRPPSGGATRPAMARRGLGGRQAPCPPLVRSRSLGGHAQIPSLESGRADGRPGRTRARPTPSACDIQRRRRPRVLPPRDRDGARSLRPGAPLQARAQRRRCA